MKHADRMPKWERPSFIRDRGMMCAYCGEGGDAWLCGGRPWHVDHILPLARGGDAHDWSNLALSCAICNTLKGQATATELRTHLRGLLDANFYPTRHGHIGLMLAHLDAA